MIRRYLMLGIIFTTITLVSQFENSAGAASAQYVSKVSTASTMSASQIRRMPLLQRPNRPGHFIGNTIRRNHSRRVRNTRYR